MKKILITFGYKQREYEYLLLLWSYLQNKGFAVRIRFMNFECYYDVYSWKPDFVILSQVNQNENIEFAKYAKKCGSRVIILNAELLFSLDRMPIRYASDSDKYVDYTIEGGNAEKYRRMVKFSHLHKDKIKMLGYPKFDVYLPTVRNKLEINRTYGYKLDGTKRTVCICTSFPEADTQWKEVKNNVAYKHFGEQKVRGMFRYQYRMRQLYIKLAKSLLRLKKYNVIFRVHPLEPRDAYIKTFASDPGLIFDNTVSQSDLFSVTDFLIHRTSTIALEAWMMNVPTATYEPIENELMPLNRFTKYEKVMRSQQALTDYLAGYFSKNSRPSFSVLQRGFLKDEFGFMKNSPLSASERIAAFLSRCSVDKKKKTVIHRYVLIYILFSFLRLLLGRNHVYEVIGLVKGDEYMRFYKENYA